MFSKINRKLNLESITKLVSKLGFLLSTHDLVIDSRQANSSSIFCAYPGTSTDGRQFIAAALGNGVDVVLYEDGDSGASTLSSLMPEDQQWREIISNCNSKDSQQSDHYFPVLDLKHYVGILAAYKYNYPCRELQQVIGITGTNGKTSIAYWLNQAYTALHKKAAIIGTLGAGVFPDIKYNEMTTPDPITVQKLFAGFVQDEVQMVAMETSSHALDQGRVNGVEFKTAVFTNLTQDHLDYHKTMEDYYLAKRELFYWDGLQNAVINIDDEYGRRLHAELLEQLDLQVMTYGVGNGEVQANNIKVTISGTKFDLTHKGDSIPVEVKVIGKFNVYNLLAVSAVLLLDGYGLHEIATVLPRLTPVRGRMDAIIRVGRPLVVVDFAHTPDSLENVLLTLSEVEHRGKVYCIFGCGGNRDTGKRPIMGAIAAKLADEVIITSDNPRFENPSDIIDQIAAGIEDVAYQRIENREEAIRTVLSHATADDIVLIAGKGHEEYQEILGVKSPFSDFTVATDMAS